MRELDALLLQYLEAGYLSAGRAERAFLNRTTVERPANR